MLHPQRLRALAAAVSSELEKEAAIGEHLTHAAELAGLGVLAVPSVHRLRKIKKKETPPEERKAAKYELAGLGILAAPSAMHLAHSAYKAFKKPKLATIDPKAMLRQGALQGAWQAAKAAPAPNKLVDPRAAAARLRAAAPKVLPRAAGDAQMLQNPAMHAVSKRVVKQPIAKPIAVPQTHQPFVVQHGASQYWE